MVARGCASLSLLHSAVEYIHDLDVPEASLAGALSGQQRRPRPRSATTAFPSGSSPHGLGFEPAGCNRRSAITTMLKDRRPAGFAPPLP
jgi:hypothetical protein